MAEGLDNIAARFKQALAESGLFLVLLGIHKSLDLGLVYFFPEFEGAIHAVRLLVFAAFLVGYLNQTLEILFTLAPWSRAILRKVALGAGEWLLARILKATATSPSPPEGNRDVEGNR